MNIIEAIKKGVKPLKNRIFNILARGIVKIVDDSGKFQKIQVTMLAGKEVYDGLQRFQEYGFASHPMSTNSLEALCGFLNGNRDNGVAFCVADTTYRLTVAEGEVALYTHKNQEAAGHRILMKADGSIEIKGTDLNITMDGDANISATGNIIANADGNIEVTAVGDATLTCVNGEMLASGTGKLTATGDVTVTGAVVKLGSAAATKGVARIGDAVVGGLITGGSAKVLADD